eukprot:6455526-Amphidinium_carterae.2
MGLASSLVALGSGPSIRQLEWNVLVSPTGGCQNVLVSAPTVQSLLAVRDPCLPCSRTRKESLLTVCVSCTPPLGRLPPLYRDGEDSNAVCVSSTPPLCAGWVRIPGLAFQHCVRELYTTPVQGLASAPRFAGAECSFSSLFWSSKICAVRFEPLSLEEWSRRWPKKLQIVDLETSMEWKKLQCLDLKASRVDKTPVRRSSSIEPREKTPVSHTSIGSL